MAYRTMKKPIKPEDHLPTYSVRNGSSLRLAFLCYYFHNGEGHSPNYHDYKGWPSPEHPGHACQVPYRDRPRWDRRADMYHCDHKEIDLIDEGYLDPIIQFEDVDFLEYLDVTTCEIDSDAPHVVRVDIYVNLPEFKDKPKDVRFTLFAPTESWCDTITHGMITILPGPPIEADDVDPDLLG